MVQTRSATKPGVAEKLDPKPNGAAEEKWHKGVAISMWQNSGDSHSNWTAFIRSKFPFSALPVGFNRYEGSHSVLEACPDTWDR